MPRHSHEVEGMRQTAALKAEARAERLRRMRQLLASGECMADVARRFNLKPETIRKQLKKGV